MPLRTPVLTWLQARAWYASLITLWLVSPAQAHHSVTADFDTTKVIAVDGQVRTLDLASPHSYLTLDVTPAGSKAEHWRVELPSLTFLRRAGWSEKSLVAGEHVRLTGSPQHKIPLELYAISITKDDGSQLPLLPSRLRPSQ